MAFISSSTTVLSFAEYSDVTATDQRLFESNEGLTEDMVEDLLIRSTERIITQLNNSLGRTIDIERILGRQNDFTDLCVYHSMHYYILPKFADFGSEDNAEFTKIGYYQNKYENLYNELVANGDWYDLDEDGTVETSDSVAAYVNLKRVR
jgi:hypothetical protein